MKKKKNLKQVLATREWYKLNSIIGYDWAMFYILLGGREAGKSYAVTDFYVKQFKKYHRPFTWLRLTENSAKKLLQNNAEKLVDPDIRRKYNLDLVTSGNNVYNITRSQKPDKKGKYKIIKKELMARVLAISTYHGDKGSALFDKDFLNDPKMYYNICLDEMNREANEKNSFDITYSFVNQLENLVRSTKKRVRIICIGNLLEDASDILCSFNFIPEEFGRYKLKSKRAVIEYIEPNEAYINRRKGTVADILAGNESTFTNKIEIDKTLVNKARLKKPDFIIKFSKKKDDWFTVWDSRTVKKYNNEQTRFKIPMRPYLDELFNAKLRDNVIINFNSRYYLYHDLITFKQFQKALSILKPSQ